MVSFSQVQLEIFRPSYFVMALINMKSTMAYGIRLLSFVIFLYYVLRLHFQQHLSNLMMKFPLEKVSTYEIDRRYRDL